MPSPAAMGNRPESTGSPPATTEIHLRVNYSEVDQMGVAYHARYLVWMDMARTEYLRDRGMTYREIEARGYRLVVADLSIRYRSPARYDDLVTVRVWVRRLASRLVTFAYEFENSDGNVLLATAENDMVSLDDNHRVTVLPREVRALLVEHPVAPGRRRRDS